MESSSIALVTGGSRGIGAAAAVALAAAGHRVGISYRERSDAAEEVLRRCTEHGVEAYAFAADVGDPDGLEALFAQVDEVGRLTVLVNNAGVVTPAAPVADYDAGRLEQLLRINVTGAFLAAGAAVRRMSTARGGTGGVIVD